MKSSLWTKTTLPEKHDILMGDLKTDVLIIGGGISGLLCAYRLKEAGVDCAVAEAKTVSSGTTSNTTAKITSQHGLIYSKIAKDYGKNTAKLYLKANEEAIKKYRELCNRIDCDFEEKDSYVYSADDRKAIEEELKVLGDIGFDAEFSNTDELRFPTAGAVKFKNQAQFHPLKFINEISKGLKIYEHTPVREISADGALTENGKIRAEKVIVATHFPFVNSHGLYFLKLYQDRSYVTAFENAGSLSGMYVDCDKKGLSFRQYNNLMLIGGGSHRTGKRGGAWQIIHDFSSKYYPGARIKYEWAAQDCISLDGIPYIGVYSRNTPNLYVASGFNKWGMTSSMISADILTDMILGRTNEYENVFSAQRRMKKSMLLLNGFEAAANLLTPSTRRCPHLGCALKWNKAERSWDCPCHGSRFGHDGSLIDNPAVKDAHVK